MQYVDHHSSQEGFNGISHALEYFNSYKDEIDKIHNN